MRQAPRGREGIWCLVAQAIHEVGITKPEAERHGTNKDVGTIQKERMRTSP